MKKGLNTYKSSYATSSGGLYSGWQYYSIDYIADVVASAQYSYYPVPNQLFPGMVGWALDSCQRDVAGLIFKFYSDIS